MGRARAVSVISVGAALVVAMPLWSASSAAAHSPVSSITLTVGGEGESLNLTAEVRYPDHDAVVGETVVGVAYDNATAQVEQVVLSALPGRPGFYRVSVNLAPGPWRVEVDAVAKTQGLQSIGFTAMGTGPPSEVFSPAPLPASVPAPVVPGAAGVTAQKAPPSSTMSAVTVGTLLVLVLAGLAVPVVLLRRRAAAVRS